jgi:hypothetical protein
MQQSSWARTPATGWVEEVSHRTLRVTGSERERETESVCETV